MARPTLKDVSMLAGVSRSTASLVLQGSSRISAPTRERVFRAVEQLGYVYNQQAASMRQARSQTLGLVVTEIENPYFAQLAMSMEESVRDFGYTLFVGYSRDELDRQRALVEAMVQRQVDGLIVLPAVGSEEYGLSRMVSSARTPVVQVTRYFSALHDYVGPDNVLAGRLVASHLAGLGVGSAVLVGGLPRASSFAERLRGLLEGFSASATMFDAEASVPSPNNAEAGASATSALLDRETSYDAIVAYSDAIAVGVYAELRARGIAPGRDIAVASFDDIPMARMLMPPLTSASTHASRVARKSSELLLARIDDPARAPERILIEPTLRPRDSTVGWRR